MATTTIKIKVSRLSSQKNQNGSYYYQVTDKDSLPKDAQLFGKDGRIGFYSSSLKGSQNTEFTAEVMVIPVTTNAGVTVNRVVFARSEQEKKQTESLEKKAQTVRRAGRAFGISASKAGEMGFERLLDTLLVDEQPESEDSK